ncbi:polyphosphate kinase 2 family protein [Nakamurella silvestris]|nr:polyphosphate kinase 2 family protein [Nakamurella silvestris]
MGKNKDEKKAKGGKRGAGSAGDLTPADAFRSPSPPVALSAISTERGPIGPADKEEAAEALLDLGVELDDLQSRLFAQGTAGDRRRVLVILQGMDTSGKDGVINHVMGLMSPAGLSLAAFKKPTAEELAHDFLWRIEKKLPEAGLIGVFNRSQYEDVLVVRVHNLVPSEVWSARYEAINAFEKALVDDGVTVVKCFLHISPEAQAERLTARLDDPERVWKYNPGDVDERGFWAEYQTAYAALLEKCSTDVAPWYIIPSDRKWYRNWAIGALLAQTLRELDPQYPPPSFDLEAERVRLKEKLLL